MDQDDWLETFKVLGGVLGGVTASGLIAFGTWWVRTMRAGKKAKVALGQQVAKWEHDAKMKEEDFIVNMRKAIVVELKAELDAVRERLDERERAESQLRRDYDDLRRQHGQCQEENAALKHELGVLRLEVKVLRRAVRKIQSDSDVEDTPPQGSKPASIEEGETRPEDQT